MKRLSAFFLTLLFLSACSERDLTYYQTHLDDAEAKVKACEEALEAAFRSEDADRLKTLVEDVECDAAKQAYSEYQREIAALERKQREEERRKQRELQEQQYAADYERHKKELATLTREGYSALGRECGSYVHPRSSAKCRAYHDTKDAWEAADYERYKKELPAMTNEDFFALGRKCGGYSRSAKCKAYRELKDAWEAVEIEVLIKKHKGAPLVELMRLQCDSTSPQKSVDCFLSRQAVRKQEQDMIDYYLANRDELKSVYNECQRQYMSLATSGRHRSASDSVKSYECNTVMMAAHKSGKYSGWGTPVK